MTSIEHRVTELEARRRGRDDELERFLAADPNLPALGQALIDEGRINTMPRSLSGLKRYLDGSADGKPTQ